MNIPALLIGLMMAFYWARVLKLAWKEKRRSGQAANLFPPERLGRILRIIWFPVIGLWIALPLLFCKPGVLTAPGFKAVYSNEMASWAAIVIAVGAFIATLVCWKRMGRAWRMGINPDDKTQLVITGPYAYMRHPIYALSSLLMLCTMVIVPTVSLWVVGVLHLILLQWESRREEKYLVQLHGRAYSDYAARTGRFFPRF